MVLFMSKTCHRCKVLEIELDKLEQANKLPDDLKMVYLIRSNGKIVYTEKLRDGTHRLIEGEKIIVKIPSLYDPKQKISEITLKGILEQICPNWSDYA